MRLVDADMLIKAVERESNKDGSYGYMDTKSIIDLIEDAPTIEPDRKWSRLIMYLYDLWLTYAPVNGHGDRKLYEFVTGLIEELETWEDGDKS